MPRPRKVIRTKRIYKKRTRPKWFGTFFFILLLLLLVGLGYLVSREWAGRFGSASPSSAVSSETAGPASEPAVSSETVSSREVSSEPAVQTSVHAVTMSFADMLRVGEDLAAYLSEVKSAGYNAVAVDLKTDQGVITYLTANEAAAQFGAVSATPADLDALAAAVKAAGLTPVARISALKDPIAPHVSRGNSYGYQNSSEVNWLDDSVANGGKPWLNPYMENARKYIADLCAEAAGKGFQTILLTNVNFPTKNTTASMGTLNEFTGREQILAQLVAECQAAAGSVPVYNCYDLAWAAADPARLTPYKTSAGPDQRRAPILNLDRIAANKQAICVNSGIVTEDGYNPDIAMEVILSGLLAEGDFPVIRRSDLPAVEPLLEGLGITSYLVD